MMDYLQTCNAYQMHSCVPSFKNVHVFSEVTLCFLNSGLLRNILRSACLEDRQITDQDGYLQLMFRWNLEGLHVHYIN